LRGGGMDDEDAELVEDGLLAEDALASLLD